MYINNGLGITVGILVALHFVWGVPEAAFGQNGDEGAIIAAPQTSLRVRPSLSGQTPSHVYGLFVENDGSSNSNYVFQTATGGAGKSFSITDAGRVGIGTTMPDSDLHVAGNGVIEGDLTVNGTLTAGQLTPSCLIESGRIGAGSASFPITVELNCFEETDELVVVTSGWFYESGANQTATFTFSSTWETDHWEIRLNVARSDGEALTPASTVALF